MKIRIAKNDGGSLNISVAKTRREERQVPDQYAVPRANAGEVLGEMVRICRGEQAEPLWTTGWS